MELVFKSAAEEDIPEIAHIEEVSFTDPWSEESLWSFASDGQVRALVTARDKESGDLIGYYALQYVLDEAEIAIIAVAAPYRRLGAGRRIIGEIISFCQKKNITSLHLEVRQGNEAAIHLYRAMGFEEVGRRKNYYEHPREDAVLFHLSI